METIRNNQLRMLRREFEAKTKQVEDNVPFFDACRRIIAKWTELTGEVLSPSFYPGGCSVFMHMGRMMKIGRYPTKSEHVSLLIEYADEHLDGLIAFDGLQVVDTDYSQDFKYGSPQRSLSLYFVHGGTCQYRQVGTELVEKPIYEMECS